ncbi:MAG TPA: cbb3-type cytochrome c oxidase subunit II [Verrucomicrobiae bacterium]|jgi:cytochrome c oxidase cbb3-type subunit 2|nr:cbb3-type cytochrome c oxidase subunit II [Verrucomicrobiae bacterium]
MNNGPLLFLGLFAAMVFSWLGFVMGPQLQIGNLPQTNTVVVGDAISQAYPVALSGNAHQGEEVYRANGCAACHTQMVRAGDSSPLAGPDISHGWGARRSVAEDYLFDQPVLLGSQRIGPDLANYGRRSSIDAILRRLYDPRSLVPGSIMPSYRFFFKTRKIEGAPSPDALVLSGKDAPAPGYEVVPGPRARSLAAYLLSLHQDGYLYEAPPPALPPPPKTNAPPAMAVKK